MHRFRIEQKATNILNTSFHKCIMVFVKIQSKYIYWQRRVTNRIYPRNPQFYLTSDINDILITNSGVMPIRV